MAHRHLFESSTPTVSLSLESLILLSYGGIPTASLRWPPFDVTSPPEVLAKRALLWALVGLLDHRVPLSLRWVSLSLRYCQTGVLSRLVASFCYREFALSLQANHKTRSLKLLRSAWATLPPAESVPLLLQPFRLREEGFLRAIEDCSEGEGLLLRSLASAENQGLEYERWLTARVLGRLGLKDGHSKPSSSSLPRLPDVADEPSRGAEDHRQVSNLPIRFRRFLWSCEGFTKVDCPSRLLDLVRLALKDIFWYLDIEVGDSQSDLQPMLSQRLSECMVVRGRAHCGVVRGCHGDAALFHGLTRLAGIALKAVEHELELKGVLKMQQRSQQVWEEAFLSTPLGVAVLRDRGIVERSNPRFRNLVADNLKELIRQIPPRIDGSFRREVQSSQGSRVLLTATSLDGKRKLLILTVLEDADKENLLNRLSQRQRRLQVKLKDKIIEPLQRLSRFEEATAKTLQTLLTAVGEHLSVLRHPLFETEDLALGFERLMVQMAPHWRIKLSGDWSKVGRSQVLKGGWLVDCLLDLAARESTLLKATVLPDGGLRLTVLWWEHLEPQRLTSPDFLLVQLGCRLALEDDRLICDIPVRGTL